MNTTIKREELICNILFLSYVHKIPCPNYNTLLRRDMVTLTTMINKMKQIA